MKAPMIRGYVLKQLVAAIDMRFDPDTRRRVLATLPPGVLDLALATKPAEWYPGENASHLLRAVVSAKNDEHGSYEDLVACGKFVASEAANTFLRILMKLMTPTLFLKKIPEFWPRDFNTGRFEADLSQAGSGLVKLTLLDAQGYDHIAGSSCGFLTFGLATIGKPNAKVTQQGWSLATPNPREVHYEVSWT
jgi:hypothetical protein